MSDALYESEIVKSLEALDEILSKAQIETGKSHQPSSWAGSKPVDEDEDEDTTEANGTDRKSPKSLSKGGRDDVEDEEEDEDDEYAGMSKGVEVSEFLNELTKSIAVYCDGLESLVTNALVQVHEENGAMSKAIAENLSALNEIIAKSQSNITEYAEGPARGPKSMLDMSKSVSGSSEPGLSKGVVLDALMKGVEAGIVSPLEIIKVEQFGVQAANQSMVKSLLA